MCARARPCVGVEIEQERVGGHPDEGVGDHVRMLGEKQRGQDGAGAGALHVGGAHPMEERGAVIAGHADDDSRVEGDDAGARAIGCFGMCHSRIKILESARVAYRGRSDFRAEAG